MHTASHQYVGIVLVMEMIIDLDTGKERSAGRLLCPSLATLKASSNIPSDDKGSQLDDLSVSVEVFHARDRTVSLPSNLYNGNAIFPKTVFILIRGPDRVKRNPVLTFNLRSLLTWKSHPYCRPTCEGNRPRPSHMACNTELWCVLLLIAWTSCCQTVELPMIWDAATLMWRNFKERSQSIVKFVRHCGKDMSS